MKKIFSLIALALLCATVSFGQDARGRVPVTVVNDVLATLPAPDAARMAADMADLAKSAPQTVELLCERLQPAAQAQNNLAEYALSGLVAYVSTPANARYADAVREGLRKGISVQADPVQRHFLLQQLRLIATTEDTGLFLQYATDAEAAATAIGALADTPAGDAALMDLLAEGKADKALLSGAVIRRGLTRAEPILFAWAADAQGAEKDAIHHALGRIGSASSANYLKNNAIDDYVVLLNNLPDKKAVSAAKSLLKHDREDIRCAAIGVVEKKADVATARKMLEKALKSDGRAYRNAALTAATERLGADAVAPIVNNVFYKINGVAQTDALNWMATQRKGSLDIALNALSGAGELGDAAIAAVGRFGGDRALDSLIAKLATPHAAAAMKALKTFEGNLEPAVVAALAKPVNTTQEANLMLLSCAKEIKGTAPQMLKKASAGDAVAVTSLAGVVGPENADAVSNLLGKAKDADIAALQKALSASLHTLTPAEQVSKIKSLMVSSPVRSRYYPVMAAVGSSDAVAALRGLASQDPAAGDAMLTMNNPDITADLLAAAKKTGNETYLTRYVDMLSAYEQNPDAKRFGLAEAIALAKTPAVRANAVSKLGSMPLMKCFLLAGKSLDDSDAGVRMAAADAVKRIAAKTTEEINYDDLKANLEAARALYQARGWADDGYAVDEINKMLLEAKPSPRSQLTEEEKAEGFEMLFDGTDLSKWHGDMEGYTVVNGAIYVSANYGSTGNLYTNKEYRNFIYRFEFCFLEEGVNNGVGVRTPENVDAAYHGMCELQILDHDAPAYAGWLQPYQVHGSIYGIVPAKRLKHKPLGEWSTEEIIVEGDHIKVTVNGEVITDADIRKACQGHNVAPDGSDHNPYTIDGHNHPGMFNYKGHLSFCGHGAGLKIRNVRIKDLGYKK